MGFWTNYAIATTTVAALLAGLGWLARRVRGARPSARRAGRSLGIVESLPLTQHASLHVVELGDRRFLIGVSDAAIASLAELAVRASEEKTGA